MNGAVYHADPYKDGFMPVPVIIDSGENRVLIKTAGFTQHDLTFKFMPTPAPLFIVVGDITLPDIIPGETKEICLGVPVINTTDQVLRNVKLKVNVENIGHAELMIERLEALSAVKIPVAMTLYRIVDQPLDSVRLDLTVSFGDFFIDASVWLSTKERDEAVNRTFISRIDRSCQYYSVLPPLNYHPESTYALIMTCHGAGVKAENQVRSYTQKDWAFVVAPTNRRRFGFDWQDWGRLDFLEVLEDVKDNYRIDENRIYLTGHSMGGHGVWHIATRHPDIFAAIAPSAGWTNFQLYIPWFLQKSEIFADPDILKYRDMALRQDNPLAYLENLENVPVYILHGGVDDNVPALHGRMFARHLDVLGNEYIYHEVPGQGHWWDFDSTPGVDCVDLEEMMDFLSSKRRDPMLAAQNMRMKAHDRSIKRAYFDPFVLVYGTTGDSISTANNLAQARYQSYAWWYRANGHVEIIPDTAVTREMVKQYNLILFGNALTNSIVKSINHKLPLRIKDGSIYRNKKRIDGDDLCVVQICPNPLNPKKLVCLYEPTTKEAEKIMGFFTPLYAGAGLPEYVVYDKSVLTYGWGGVRAAGFLEQP